MLTLINIRRNPKHHDKCCLCDENQPNIDKIKEKYHVIEHYDDTPEGRDLYYKITNQSNIKLLPLTAIFKDDKLIKYWNGKVVNSVVYERFLKEN